MRKAEVMRLTRHPGLSDLLMISYSCANSPQTPRASLTLGSLPRKADQMTNFVQNSRAVHTQHEDGGRIAFDIKRADLWYTDLHALKNINMDIPASQVTAFIGPSGCGKSTLLKSLNRMNDLIPGCRITGQFLLNGENIYSPQMEVNLLRKRVGMVFQKPNPFPMSIYDNIAYGPRTHGMKGKLKLDEIVEKSLRQAALWDEMKDNLKKSAMAISGGQ